ncbi:DUF3139 domain-containing protein [Neobacillus mesonae]|nr:DUF3139 domain-containing protein [Neobacillus mesonae]
MKKVIKIVGGVFLGSIILGIGFIVYVLYSLNTPPKSNPELITYTQERVKDYLIEQKGYSESEILHVESKKEPKDADTTASGYSIAVVFSDEPNGYYFYQVANNEVRQHGTNGGVYKHKE